MGCELLQRGLARARGICVVCAAMTSQQFSEAVAEFSPDVALVSANLQDGPFVGFKVVRRIKEQRCATRSVVVLDTSERDLVVDAFRAGARGVFHRSASLASLCRCISAVHQGQIWASTVELQHLLDAFENAVPFRCLDARGKSLLTRREQQLLPLVAEGRSNAEIASLLRVSEHTVKNHLFHVYEKLGISTRVELILYAVSQQPRAVAA
jgi:DNA-binding NarL/FixJ family response regulator